MKLVVPDPSLEPNHLLLVTGSDFTTVMQTPRPPAPTTTTVPPPGPDQSTPTDSAPPSTTTTQVGITPGEAPPDVNC